MEIGVFAKTFAGEHPDAVFAQCRAAGFSAVQYNMACSGLGPLPTKIPDGAILEIGEAAQAHQIQISAISATYNMIDPKAERRNAGRAAFAQIAQCAADLGVSLLTVCTGSMDVENQWRAHPDNSNPASWDEMCREFDLLLEVANRHDVLIGVEPEPANVVSCATKAARLLDRFSSERIRIVFDPANLVEQMPFSRHRETIDGALQLLGPSIALVHAKDWFDDGRVAPAGKGVLDWEHILSGLVGMKFSGPLIAHGMAAKDAPGVSDYLTNQVGKL
ncbi:MAG: sugar phosphate isomerase/epimerase family protein [Pseudomonadota bacterium]